MSLSASSRPPRSLALTPRSLQEGSAAIRYFSSIGSTLGGSLTLFSVLALWFVHGAALAQPTRDNDAVVQAISASVRQVFENSRKAVVRIECKDSSGKVFATGFYIDAMGTLLSLAAVAADAREIYVIREGQRLPAELLLHDARSGLAILRTENGSCSFLSLGDSDALRIATPVILVGYPMDLDLSPGFGLISGFDRRFGGLYFSTTHIRSNIPVQQGQGGSPLLNLSGEVVGVVTSSVDGGNTCYAIPVKAVEKIRSDFQRYGAARHGWMGVKVEALENPVYGSLAVICDLEESAPAKTAGLQVGDVVLQVGERLIHCPEDVLDASFFLTSGQPVEVAIVREGQPLSFQVEPALHPSLTPPDLHAATPSSLERSFSSPEQP